MFYVLQFFVSEKQELRFLFSVLVLMSTIVSCYWMHVGEVHLETLPILRYTQKWSLAQPN